MAMDFWIFLPQFVNYSKSAAITNVIAAYLPNGF